jgi:hypothetical protein
MLLQSDQLLAGVTTHVNACEVMLARGDVSSSMYTYFNPYSL